MNTVTQTKSPLARFGRRVAAIVAECNRAQTMVASSQHTPERF